VIRFVICPSLVVTIHSSRFSVGACACKCHSGVDDSL